MMIVPPPVSKPLDLTVRAPGSKSITNRALVCAALATGISELRGVATGDDTLAMVAALTELGVDISRRSEPGESSQHGSVPVLAVAGLRGHLTAVGRTLQCGLAGTTSRFLAALLALGPGPNTLDGAARLRARPMGPLLSALRSLGTDVVGAGSGDDDTLPVEIRGPARGGRLEISAGVSSQFISALMMIGPSLEGGLEIALSTELVSRPYVEMTAAVMSAFGVDCEIVHDRIVVPEGGYRARRFDVEPDASSASYPIALVGIHGGRIAVEGIGTEALQGDRVFADIAAQMGCRVRWGLDSVIVERDGGEALRGIDLDLGDCSDLVPSVAVMAACASGPSRLDGIGFIRNKESDRIGDLARELRRIGVAVTEHPNGMEIEPASHEIDAVSIQTASIRTYHDHRIAMAFAVLSSGLCRPLRIENPEVVSKSWPTFWDELDRWCTGGRGRPSSGGG